MLNFIYAKETDQHSGGAMADMNRRCFMKMLSGAALTTTWLLEAAEKGHSAAASASASASASAPVTGA